MKSKSPNAMAKAVRPVPKGPTGVDQYQRSTSVLTVKKVSTALAVLRFVLNTWLRIILAWTALVYRSTWIAIRAKNVSVLQFGESYIPLRSSQRLSALWRTAAVVSVFCPICDGMLVFMHRTRLRGPEPMTKASPRGSSTFSARLDYRGEASKLTFHVYAASSSMMCHFDWEQRHIRTGVVQQKTTTFPQAKIKNVKSHHHKDSFWCSCSGVFYFLFFIFLRSYYVHCLAFVFLQ